MDNLSGVWVKIIIFVAGAVGPIAVMWGSLHTRVDGLEGDLADSILVQNDQAEKISELSDVRRTLTRVLKVQEDHGNDIISGKMERNTLNSDIKHIKESLKEMVVLLKDLRTHHQHPVRSTHRPDESGG